jgi:hypothetical protein
MLPGWQEPVGSGLLGPGEFLDTSGISHLFARGTVTIEKECARHTVLITVVRLFFSLGLTILSLFVQRSFFLGEYRFPESDL